MFQLIVATIAIALVMVLCLASLFFGGEAFKEAQARAEQKGGQSKTIVQERQVERESSRPGWSITDYY